jgi:hypothetical protein
MRHDESESDTLPLIGVPIHGKGETMTKQIASGLLAVLLCLTLWTMHAQAQDLSWEAHNSAGLEALQRGEYADAEK